MMSAMCVDPVSGATDLSHLVWRYAELVSVLLKLDPKSYPETTNVAIGEQNRYPPLRQWSVGRSLDTPTVLTRFMIFSSGNAKQVFSAHVRHSSTRAHAIELSSPGMFSHLADPIAANTVNIPYHGWA